VWKGERGRMKNLKEGLKKLKEAEIKEPVKVFRPIKIYFGNGYFLNIKESGEVKPEGIIIDVYKFVPNEDGEELKESFTYWYDNKKLKGGKP